MTAPPSVEELTRRLEWDDDREALEALLDDELERFWSVTTRAALVERVRERPDAAPARLCARCENLCLEQYLPEDGRCRVCGGGLSPSRVGAAALLGPSGAVNGSARELAEGPLPEAVWALAAARARADAPGESGAGREAGVDAATSGALEASDAEELREEVDWGAKLASVAERREARARAQGSLGWLLSAPPAGEDDREEPAPEDEVAATERPTDAEVSPAEPAASVADAPAPAEQVGPESATSAAAEARPAAESAAPAEPATPAPALARAGGEPLELAPGRALRFGTGRSNDVVLRQRGVGFKHAVVHVAADGACEVEDLGGSGGVWVNGQRVPARGRAPLRPGDELRIGEETFQLTAPAPVASPAASPEPPDAPSRSLEAPEPSSARSAPAAAAVPEARERDEAEAESAAPAPAAAPVEVEVVVRRLLRVESGKHEGTELPLEPGRTVTIGTARTSDLVLRERGVAFRHAAVHVASDGSCEVEDLGGKRGVKLDDERLPDEGRAPLRAGSALSLGGARVRLLEREERRERPAAPAAAPSAPTRPRPTRRDAPDPAAVLSALPEPLLDLAGLAARAVPLERLLAEAEGEQRLHLEQDARDFARLVRDLLKSAHVPEPIEGWVRWDAEASEFLARSDAAGVVLAMRCWELLARLPARARGVGPNRTTHALSLLLAPDAARLVPAETEELTGGFWRCTYRSPVGLLGQRFEQVEAISDGLIVAAVFQPRFAINPMAHDLAEDPIAEAIRAGEERVTWRPPPASLGPRAPHHPPGGRLGRRRHKPTRVERPDRRR